MTPQEVTYLSNAKRAKVELRYFLMLLQDDSNRFDRPDNFGGSSPFPARPWSASPRTGEFKIAFEHPPNASPFVYDIVYDHYTRNVVTGEDPSASEDSDDGTEHAIVFNGRVILRVRERQQRDEDIGVKFDPKPPLPPEDEDLYKVCRRADGTLQGYVALTSKVGIDDDGGEGYYVVQVLKYPEALLYKRVTVAFQRLKMVNTAPPGPFTEGLPLKPELRFRFRVQGGAFHSFPKTGTREFPWDQSIDLPPGDLTFTVEPSLNPLQFEVDTRLQVCREEFQGGFGGEPGGEPRDCIEEDLTLSRSYGREMNYGEGIYPADKSSGAGVFFELAYTISVQDLGGGSPTIFPPTGPDISIRGVVKRPSLHRAVIDGRPQLLGDLELQVVGGPRARPSDLAVSRVESVFGNQRRAQAFQPLPATTAAGRGLVPTVPVLAGSPLELTMKSGARMSLGMPAISLAPSIALEPTQRATADGSAWAAMATVAGGLATPAEPPIPLLHVREWELDVAPGYAPVREGRVSREDDSPVAEELNEVIGRGDVRRMRQLFDSSQPFTLEWSFEAMNLTTGVTVPVTVGQGAAMTDVHVELLPGKVPEGRIKVSFPEQPTNAIYELVATANMTDTFGTTGTVQHRVWSHVLSADSEDKLVEALLPTVAALAGVSAEDLIRAGRLDVQPDDAGRPGDTRSRRARMVRLFMMKAAEDKRVTVDELRMLIRGAQQFGRPE